MELGLRIPLFSWVGNPTFWLAASRAGRSSRPIVPWSGTLFGTLGIDVAEQSSIPFCVCKPHRAFHVRTRCRRVPARFQPLSWRFLFRWISAKLTRDLLWGATPVNSFSAAPCIEAATAHPTMQSSQWLSPRSGRDFHSSTLRPRPSVLILYSAVRCSAKSRCISGESPKSDRQPRSPKGTESRPYRKDFQ